MMAVTELPEDKIARLLKERVAEIDQLRRLPDDLDPMFRRWRDRLVTVLREGVRQGVVGEETAKAVEYQEFAEPRIKMFDEPDRSLEDREYYLRGLTEVGIKLEAELERIAEFGGWPAQPATEPRRPGTADRLQPGPVTNINMRDIINQGGMQLGGQGNVQTNAVRWDSPEAAAALDELIARVQEIVDDATHEMLGLLGEMKGAKEHHERFRIANMIDKLVKMAPAFRWVWEVAKPKLGL